MKKRILLTGDDGYNSIGTRLLIRALKDDYDLHIAATKHQQSGVGGMLNLAKENEWGEATVEGVPALWVEGTPADVMELSQGYFDKPFDLIISGINLGANTTSAVISSGTYSAAVRGLGVKVAPKAIAISWDAPPGFWHKKHDENEDLTPYLENPGRMVKPLMKLILDADLWGVQLLNVNLPKQVTTSVKFTKILKDITRYFSYPLLIDRKKKVFSYSRNPFSHKETNLRYDAAAVTQGHISISPCAFDMTHFTTFEKLEGRDVTI
jgi:5'-nucleotidase